MEIARAARLVISTLPCPSSNLHHRIGLIDFHDQRAVLGLQHEDDKLARGQERPGRQPPPARSCRTTQFRLALSLGFSSWPWPDVVSSFPAPEATGSRCCRCGRASGAASKIDSQRLVRWPGAFQTRSNRCAAFQSGLAFSPTRPPLRHRSGSGLRSSWQHLLKTASTVRERRGDFSQRGIG